MPMGVMVRFFKVICGCGAVQELNHAAAWRTARADAKALGWKFTDGQGWICPKCQVAAALEEHEAK